MRAGAVILALGLGACATDLPPELRDPAGHVRPVERGADEGRTDIPDLMIEAAADPARACELYRLGAQTGEPGAPLAFARCTAEAGDWARAKAVVEVFDLPEDAALAITAVAETMEDSEADEAALNAAIAVAPERAELWSRLGDEYARQGRDAEATEAWVEAHRLSLVSARP